MHLPWQRRRNDSDELPAAPNNQPSPSFSEASTEIPQWNRPSLLRSTSDGSSHMMMDEILSPDSEVVEQFFSDDDAEEQKLSGSSCDQSEGSGDSINQRVEEEIAAARMAAAAANSNSGRGLVDAGTSAGAGNHVSWLVNDEAMSSRTVPSKQRPTAYGLGEEFEDEFNGINRDDQISLFSGNDELSSFDYFAEEFKDCGDSVDTQQVQNQQVASPMSTQSSSATNRGGHDADSQPSDESRICDTHSIISPTTTVETLTENSSMPNPTSWESFETRRNEEKEHKLDVCSLGALSSATRDEEKDETLCAHDASSIGTSVGGTRNAQRARAILDTLKERRETFKSVFLTSNTLNKSPIALLPVTESILPSDGIIEEKKEEDATLAPWNCPVIEALPIPIKSKLKKKETDRDLELNLEEKAEAKVKEVEETINRKSRRIRFRDPFSVIKPARRPRAAKDIIAEHSLGAPDFPIRWVRPKTDLKQLIVAAMGSSLARRSNACGALKVLTGQKKNQLTLARTDSFLDALIFAASQTIPLNDEHELALNARTRAVACLKNVCEPKDNRIHMLLHAGNMECLAKVIREDTGEARVLACMALALLAKTPECRESMVKMDGLLALLAHVLAGNNKNSSDGLKSEFSHESGLSLSADELGSGENSGLGSESDYSVRSRDREGEEDGSHSKRSDDEASSSDNSTLSECSTDRDISGRHTSSTLLIKSHKQKIAEKNAELLPKARSNACAVILHLSKHCAVLSQLCSDSSLVHALVAVANENESPLHSKCLEIICNLTRFPPNTSFMTRYEGLVDILVMSADSPLQTDRTFSLRSLQNMSADSSSKALLATEAVLSKITECALRNNYEEKEAAVAFLYNVSTEPGAVVAITNTKNVVATLVHLAHHPESPSDVRLMACDALATISLWLQTLAGTGRVPKDLPNVPLPSHKTTGWNRWD